MRLTEQRTLAAARVGNQHNLIWEFTSHLRYGVEGMIIRDPISSSVAGGVNSC